VLDEEIQSHVFRAVVEPDELIAEIYSYHKKLQKSWSLSEGRQRIDPDDWYNNNNLVSNSDDAFMPLQGQSTEREQAMMEQMREMEQDKVRVREWQRQCEQERNYESK
jgi:hypothetical protein